MTPFTAAAWRDQWRGKWRVLHKPLTVALAPGVPEGGVGGEAHPRGLVPAHDQALLAWRTWCEIHAGRRCRLALSSQWVLCGVVQGQDAASAEQAQAHIAKQWGHYTDLTPEALARGWWLRSTRTEAGWLVCAAPRALVSDLLALAQARGVLVTWMGPWWVAGAQRWVSHLAGRGALVGRSARLQLQEPGWATTLALEGGRVSGVWAESAGSGAGDGSAATGTTVVALTDRRQTSQACLWSDVLTHAVVTGQDAAWTRGI